MLWVILELASVLWMDFSFHKLLLKLRFVAIYSAVSFRLFQRP